MRLALFVVLLVHALCGSLARADSARHPHRDAGALQVGAAVDPAYAARLLVAEQISAAPIPSPHENASVSPEQWRQARRGRWLLGAGVGIMSGSVIGGVLAGRRRYCEHHEYYVDKTPPRVASAVVGAFGLGFTVVGATRLFGLTRNDRERARAGTGQRVGIALMAVGLSVASLMIITSTALPEWVNCETT